MNKQKLAELAKQLEELFLTKKKEPTQRGSKQIKRYPIIP